MKKTIFTFTLCLIAILFGSSFKSINSEYYDIYFHNKIDKNLHISLRYVPYNKDKPNDTEFETKAWFILVPGEVKLLARTRFVQFYWYADTPYDSNMKRDEWKGIHPFLADGKIFDFNEEEVVIPELQKVNGVYTYTVNITK